MTPAPKPRRKRIRLHREAYACPGQPFFLTICTAGKRQIFSRPRHAAATFAALREGCLCREAECLAACLMPDHLHLLLVPKETDLILLLNRWKSFTTNLLHDMGLSGPVWQRSFFDHALRRNEAVPQVAEYIVNNPVRRGLVTDRRAYPYSYLQWWEPDS